MNAPLYNPRILRLAAEIPHTTRLARPHATAEVATPICGSRIAVDVALDADKHIAALGQDVHACALGQASASLMGAHAIGRSCGEIERAGETLAAWLAGERDDPGDWPGLDALAPARSHTSRHAAILLPFEAAAEAARMAASR